MTPDETLIRSLVEAWAQAVRDKNMADIIANHTDDVVMFDVPVPPQSTGLDEYRKTWELFFEYNKGGPGSFDVLELRVTAGDTTAFCHGFVDIFGNPVRVTMGLRKEGGRWLIAHEHHSYPVELPSDN